MLFKLSQLKWRSWPIRQVWPATVHINKVLLESIYTASCVPYGDYITVGVGGDWSGQSRHEANAFSFLHDLC